MEPNEIPLQPGEDESACKPPGSDAETLLLRIQSIVAPTRSSSRIGRSRPDGQDPLELGDLLNDLWKCDQARYESLLKAPSGASGTPANSDPADQSSAPFQIGRELARQRRWLSTRIPPGSALRDEPLTLAEYRSLAARFSGERANKQEMDQALQDARELVKAREAAAGGGVRALQSKMLRRCAGPKCGEKGRGKQFKMDEHTVTLRIGTKRQRVFCTEHCAADYLEAKIKELPLPTEDPRVTPSPELGQGAPVQGATSSGTG